MTWISVSKLAMTAYKSSIVTEDCLAIWMDPRGALATKR